MTPGAFTLFSLRTADGNTIRPSADVSFAARRPPRSAPGAENEQLSSEPPATDGTGFSERTTHMLQARSGHGSPEKPRLRAKPHAAKRIAVRRRRKKPTSSPAWYYHTINGEKRQEFCPKNWQESKFLSSRHKFSQKNRRKTAKKHPAPTKTPPKTSLKMFHMKLSRELQCFT